MDPPSVLRKDATTSKAKPSRYPDSLFADRDQKTRPAGPAKTFQMNLGIIENSENSNKQQGTLNAG